MKKIFYLSFGVGAFIVVFLIGLAIFNSVNNNLQNSSGSSNSMQTVNGLTRKDVDVKFSEAVQPESKQFGGVAYDSASVYTTKDSTKVENSVVVTTGSSTLYSSTLNTEDEKSKLNSKNESFTSPDSKYRKQIKTGEINILVKKSIEAQKSITEKVASLGGYIFSENVQKYENHTNISLVIKLPPDKLDIFKNFTGKEGEVLRSNINSEDITNEYYDSKARLQNLESYRKQLMVMLEKAVKTEDSLQIWREINDIQSQIDSLRGQLNMWDNLVSMSTIYLNISETDKIVAVTKNMKWSFTSISDIIILIQNGFMGTINIIYTCIVWIIIVIVAAAPALVIMSPFAFFIWRYFKKRKTKIVIEQIEVVNKDDENS